ncbi:MAG: hybrid sensor histidine kinase/response regulator [Anaeromyxobacter sp.]
MSGAARISGTRIADPALEGAYRRAHLREHVRSATIFLLFASLAGFLFIPSDVHFLGTGPAFVGLLAVRFAYLGAVLVGLRLLRPGAGPERFDAVVTGLGLLLMGFLVVLGASRPRDWYFNFVTEVSLVSAFWAFVPLPFRLQAVVGASHLAALLVVLRVFRAPLPGPAESAIVGAFGLAIGAGATMSWRLHRIRREQFLALREEEALRREREEALAAAQVADRAKSVFLASVSHEILTPLNAILGFSEVLLRRGHPEDREALSSIRMAGRALSDLLVDVLELARGEAKGATVRAAWCSPAALLEEVRRLVAPRCEVRGVGLRVEAAGLPGGVRLDVGRVRQILLNLAGNAARATRAGEIVLRARARPGGPGQVDLELEVADTGPGIPADELPRLFEPFERGAAEAGEGTGLGLWVSRRFAEWMGGRITVESAEGKGTTVRVSLPGVPLDLAGPPAPAREEWRLPGVRLLVADDEPANLALVRSYLEGQPLELAVASRGEEALAALEARPFAAALLDLRMPGMSGREVARRLSRRPRPALLAWTAAPPGEALPEGFDGLVPKPATRDELLAALAGVLPGATRRTAAASGPEAQGGALADTIERELRPGARALAELPSAAAALALAARAEALARDHGDAGVGRWAARMRAAAASLDPEAVDAVVAELDGELARLRAPAAS